MSLNDWVSDQLHELFGFSDSLTMEFLIDMARKEKKPAALLKALETCAIPPSEKSRRFAQELWRKVTREEAGCRYKAREKKALEKLRKKNESFALLEDDDEEKSQLERAKLKNGRKRRKHVEEETGEDEFAQRLQEKEDRELAILTEDQVAEYIKLRKFSREEYLKKRTKQQIEVIEDEEFFGEENLTEAEKQRHKMNKELLRLVEEREAGLEKVQGYAMPDGYLSRDGRIDKDKLFEALTKRHEP